MYCWMFIHNQERSTVLSHRGTKHGLNYDYGEVKKEGGGRGGYQLSGVLSSIRLAENGHLFVVQLLSQRIDQCSAI